MKKLLQDIARNPRYFTDKLTKKSKISAADHSYFTNNGKAIKAVYKIIEMFGNTYKGK